jgi:hypothetical protein
MRTNSFFSMRKFLGCLFVACLFFSFQTVYAQDDEGTPIQKDIYLGSQIFGTEDLPDTLTVSLYGSESATTPLGTQIFPRGEYTLDFDFNKSNGVILGPIARLNVSFTNKLNMGEDPDNPNRVKELWSEVSIEGKTVGDRTTVSDEAMVRLLLASDASIATYLTLAYEGDGNPITTIYKDLPVSTLGEAGSASSLKNYFSAVVTSGDQVSVSEATRADFWLAGTGGIYYDGNVGVHDSAPNRDLSVKYSSNQGSLAYLPAITVANTNTTAGEFSFASFEFSGANEGVIGQFFADGSGFFMGGTPNVYFRATTDSPMLLGTNNTVRMVISNTGNVGIGLGTTMPSNALDVFGTVRCKELIVTNTWADFVFKDNYKLPALNEVEDFISKNKHLPGIPSEMEVKKKGVSVGSISSKLLQKIEELTLYVIGLKKENDLLKGQIAAVQAQIDGRKK